MKYFFLIIIFSLNAFSFQAFIDTVYYYKIGVLEFQDSINTYYPNNIFGRQSDRASKDVPESSPEQILSIGIGGEIIVGFKDYIIKDGEGVDFVIFENAFINPINQGIFAEPAKISVSFDGINYTDFPFDSSSLNGLAGITPTNGKVDVSKYPACGGDGFDLSAIGIDKIRYIKIKDVSDIIYNLNEDSKYYNPKELISGFDLDAVAGLNLELITDVEVYKKSVPPLLFPNPAMDNITINSPFITMGHAGAIELNESWSIEIYDVIGMLIQADIINQMTPSHRVNIEHLNPGLYFVKIFGGKGSYYIVEKFVKM